MRYTEFIGANDDVIERRSIKPKLYLCLQCGKKETKGCHSSPNLSGFGTPSTLLDFDPSRRVSISLSLLPVFSVSDSRRPYKGQYSYEVRKTAASALIRDRQLYRLVMERMQEGYRLQLWLGYLHQCFL